MELAAVVDTYLRTGSWLGRTEDNPIEVADRVVYVRYDSTAEVPATDAQGGAYLRYFWRHCIVAWERVYNDAEGRQKLSQAKANPAGRFRAK